MAVSRWTAWVAAGLLARLLMIAVYLLCKSKRMSTSAMILDISMGADMVISLLLTSGVSAGFGATNDVKRFVAGATWKDPAVQKILQDYYNRAIVAIVFLLVGMLLSICATAVSARLRSKAINDRRFDGA